MNAFAPESTVQRRPRILVADDVPINRMLAESVLQSGNYVVDVVCDGEAAVLAVEATPYDLVLMDLDMPVLNGFAAAAAIRQRQTTLKGVKIAAFTTHPGSAARTASDHAGMDDYIERPIDPRSLLLRVQALLSDAAGNPPDSTELVWNKETYDDLVARLGAEKMLAFLRSLEARLDEVATALTGIEAVDDETARQVHDIKAVAGMLGFDEVSKVCGAVQDDHHLHNPRSHLPNLRGATERAIGAIRELLR